MNATDSKSQSKGVEPTASVSPLQQPVTRQQPPTGIVGLQAGVGNAALAAAASNGSLGPSSRLLTVQSTYGNAVASRNLQTQRTGGGKAASPPFDTGTSVQHFIQRAAPTTAAMRPQEEEGEPLDARIRAVGVGQSLAPAVQRDLEGALGANLSGVRVHADAESDRLSRVVDAVAFTTGRDVFFRSEAYNPSSIDGMRLLAHEATHVVQQASGPVAGTPASDGVQISDPGDSFERQADRVADAVVSAAGARLGATIASAGLDGDGLAAQQNSITGSMGGSVPAVQRAPLGLPDKPSGTVATQNEVTMALSDYLYKILEAQGGQLLQVTSEVRMAVQMLAQGDPGLTLRLDTYLDGKHLPGSPDEFARQITKLLPATIPRARIKHLGVDGPKSPPGTSPRTFGKAAGAIVVDSTIEQFIRKLPISKALQDTLINGARDAIGDGLIGILDRSMSESPLDSKTKSALRSLVEGAIKDSGKGMNRQQEGAGSPFNQPMPPSVVPPLPGAQGESIFKSPPITFGLPKAPDSPKPNIPQAPQAGDRDAANKAIESLDNNALIPPEARGKPEANSFPSAQDLARDLTNRLDAAHKAKQFSVDLVLSDAYGKVQGIQPIFDEVARIVGLVREALPHHASNVGQVVVSIAGRPNVRRIVKLGGS